MANIKSARKRALQSEAQKKHNASLKSRYRTQVKKVEAAVAANNPEKAAELLKATITVLDSTASKRIIHKNTAARCKSRLNAKVKNMKSCSELK